METFENHDVILFESITTWHDWLDVNFGRNKGLWLKISKKGATYPSISYSEALDEALCYGWIDGQKQSYDDSYYLQKFTQRRSKSVWSKTNVGHIARLTEAGKMKPSGQAEVDAAQTDGRWERAYEGSRSMKMSKEFEEALAVSPKAKAFYDSLNRTHSYAILWRLGNMTNPEARKQKVAHFIGMLERGETLH